MLEHVTIEKALYEALIAEHDAKRNLQVPHRVQEAWEASERLYPIRDPMHALRRLAKAGEPHTGPEGLAGDAEAMDMVWRAVEDARRIVERHDERGED